MKQLTLITFILSWIGTMSVSIAQDKTITTLGPNEYIQNLTAKKGEILTYNIIIPEDVEVTTVFLKTHVGQALIRDDWSQFIERNQHGNVQAITSIFSDNFETIEIEAIDDFVGTLEIFTSEYPAFYVGTPDLLDYSEIETNVTAYISKMPLDAEERFFHVMLNIPAGLDKVVLSWDPEEYPSTADNADLFVSRTSWMGPGETQTAQLSANEGNDTVILNYPNPGPVYITIGSYDAEGNLAFGGYLDVMTSEAPHASPIASVNYEATDPYQSTPIFFFQRSDNFSHFFTADMNEKDIVSSTLPVFNYQGISHHVISNPTLNATPVYRFRNLHHSTHFYTANLNEAKQLIFYSYNNYEYEGIAFQALLSPEAGTSPVYRFFQPTTGSHFFTINENEKNELAANSDLLLLEGIAWYAFP